MYKTVIKLKQHTPIIHFQHDQEGATLRATELKPKLDRFLLQNNQDILEEWIMDTEKGKSLQYKLKIEATNKKVVPATKDNTKGFFGNLGGSSKKELVYNRDVKLTFFSWHKDLIAKIEDNAGKFFRTHNFGSRQNRGFGSFTISTDNNGIPEKAQFAFKAYKEDTISLRNPSLDLAAMEVIDWFYKSLRQGINHGTFSRSVGFIPWLYMKPMIFQYAATRNPSIQWEKKTIKEWFFNGSLQNQQLDHPADADYEPEPLFHASENKLIVRDLFGLSTEQTWMNYPRTGSRSSITKEDSRLGRNELTKEEKEKVIERFPSPITFKPIQHVGDDFMTIYFWAEELPENYRNSSFKIKVGNRSNQHTPLSIWSEFRFSDFFEFAFAENRLENSIHLIEEGGEGLESLLIDIYTDIRNNRINNE